MTIIKHTKYKVCCYGSYKCYYLECNRLPIFILCFENFTINSLSNLNTTLQQTAKRIILASFSRLKISQKLCYLQWNPKLLIEC